METFLVKSSLFHKEVDIELALVSHASQENCDSDEHALMIEAAKCIKELREEKEKYFELMRDLYSFGEWSQIYKQASAQVQEILDAQEIKN